MGKDSLPIDMGKDLVKQGDSRLCTSRVGLITCHVLMAVAPAPVQFVDPRPPAIKTYRPEVPRRPHDVGT
jgi:hypothetical protein